MHWFIAAGDSHHTHLEHDRHEMIKDPNHPRLIQVKGHVRYAERLLAPKELEC